MPEITGKLETTYVWKCGACNHENKLVDSKQCIECGQYVTSEKVIRHFKLIPTPMKLGFHFG